MKLHLGCGTAVLSDFVNMDGRSIEGVDVVGDISALPAIDDNTVELIYACHVLEHFPKARRLNVMQRWYNVLSPNGILRVAVPDFEKVVHLYKSGVEVDLLSGFLYGRQNYDLNFHYYCWDFKSLKNDLKKVGFRNIRRYDWRKTEHANVDDYSQSYWPHMDKDRGVLMSLNVEGEK